MSTEASDSVSGAPAPTGDAVDGVSRTDDSNSIGGAGEVEESAEQMHRDADAPEQEVAQERVLSVEELLRDEEASSEPVVPAAATPDPARDGYDETSGAGDDEQREEAAQADDAASEEMPSSTAKADPAAVHDRHAVPRLDELLVRCLAQNYAIYPALDYIPKEYVDQVVALLDPGAIEFDVAAKYIKAEPFWCRLCEERWGLVKLSEHGSSWKRMYMERYLQEALEEYHPSVDDINFDALLKVVGEARSHVHTLRITQLPSHLDLMDVLGDFPHLCALELTYGAKNVGMDFKKDVFGLREKDLERLAALMHGIPCLSRLSLCENLLDDQSIRALEDGFIMSSTLTTIDLSHNRIGDEGARILAGCLHENALITEINLADNRIGGVGGSLLAEALSNNRVVERLSVRLNPLGDEGTQPILMALVKNTALRRIDLGGTRMTNDSYDTLCYAVSSNQTVTHVDVSCNSDLIPEDGDGGAALGKAVLQSPSLCHFDLRKTGFLHDNVMKQVRAHVNAHMVASKQSRRKNLQNYTATHVQTLS